MTRIPHHRRVIAPMYIQRPRGPVPRGGGCGLVVLLAIFALGVLVAAGDWLAVAKWLAIGVGILVSAR